MKKWLKRIIIAILLILLAIPLFIWRGTWTSKFFGIGSAVTGSVAVSSFSGDALRNFSKLSPADQARLLAFLKAHPELANLIGSLLAQGDGSGALKALENFSKLSPADQALLLAALKAHPGMASAFGSQLASADGALSALQALQNFNKLSADQKALLDSILKAHPALSSVFGSLLASSSGVQAASQALQNFNNLFSKDQVSLDSSVRAHPAMAGVFGSALALDKGTGAIQAADHFSGLSPNNQAHLNAVVKAHPEMAGVLGLPLISGDGNAAVRALKNFDKLSSPGRVLVGETVAAHPSVAPLFGFLLARKDGTASIPAARNLNNLSSADRALMNASVQAHPERVATIGFLLAHGNGSEAVRAGAAASQRENAQGVSPGASPCADEANQVGMTAGQALQNLNKLSPADQSLLLTALKAHPERAATIGSLLAEGDGTGAVRAAASTAAPVSSSRGQVGGTSQQKTGAVGQGAVATTLQSVENKISSWIRQMQDALKKLLGGGSNQSASTSGQGNGTANQGGGTAGQGGNASGQGGNVLGQAGAGGAAGQGGNASGNSAGGASSQTGSTAGQGGNAAGQAGVGGVASQGENTSGNSAGGASSQTGVPSGQSGVVGQKGGASPKAGAGGSAQGKGMSVQGGGASGHAGKSAASTGQLAFAVGSGTGAFGKAAGAPGAAQGVPTKPGGFMGGVLGVVPGGLASVSRTPGEEGTGEAAPTVGLRLHPELIPRNIKIVRFKYDEDIIAPGESTGSDIDGSGFTTQFKTTIHVDSAEPRVSSQWGKLVTPNQIHGTLTATALAPTRFISPRILINNQIVFVAADPLAVVRLHDILIAKLTGIENDGRLANFVMIANLTDDDLATLRFETDSPGFTFSPPRRDGKYIVGASVIISPQASPGAHRLRVYIGSRRAYSHRNLFKVLGPNIGKNGFILGLAADDRFQCAGGTIRATIWGSDLREQDIKGLSLYVGRFQPKDPVFTYVSSSRLTVTFKIPVDTPPGEYPLLIANNGRLAYREEDVFEVVEAYWLERISEMEELTPGRSVDLRIRGRGLTQGFADGLVVSAEAPGFTIGKVYCLNENTLVIPLKIAPNVVPGDYVLTLRFKGVAEVRPRFGSVIRVSP